MKTVCNPERIKEFVRNGLGCACPDDVFAAMLTDTAVTMGQPQLGYRRVMIGGRLLLYLMPIPREILTAESVRLLLANGKDERDARGCNRLRLVLFSDEPESDRVRIESIVRGLPDVDERVHVHVMASSERAGLE